MKTEPILFPDIKQFREVVKQVRDTYRYVGRDEAGEPITNPGAVLPTITFSGTVKLHGTNASAMVDREGNIQCQSRTQIITPEKDNAGFAQFVNENKHYFKWAAFGMLKYSKADTLVIYGEFCGKGIQKGVGICELDKFFYVFNQRYIFEDGTEEWTNYKMPGGNVKVVSASDFKTFTITVDFNYPELVQNDIVKLVEEVENECPVAKAFGISGIGEGIVWTGTDDRGNRYVFKTKGEKHSVTKVKTLVEVDVEKIANIKEFVEYAVTPQRIEQAITEVGSDDIKNLGAILRWTVNDVWKEEADTLAENQLMESKNEVNKALSQKAKEIYFARST